MKRVLLFIGAACLLFLPFAFSQTETAVTASPAAVTENVSWVWGEVKAVDAAASTLTISYIDYQTEEDRELVLRADSETKFENIDSLAAVKAGDIASIDYVVKNGVNVIKNISIEKMEEAVDVSAVTAAAEPAKNPAPKQ